MSVDDDILVMFLEEAAERLDTLEHWLLRAESEPTSAGIGELFRAAHSIKGAAGMVGLEEVAALAHAVEDVLHDARERDILPSKMIAPLLEATDALRRAVDGHPEVVPPAVMRLAEAREHDAAATGTSSTQVAPGPASDERPPGEPEGVERVSVRVNASSVDLVLEAAGEALLHHRRIEHALSADRPDRGGDELGDLLDRGEGLLEDLQHSALGLRSVPFELITGGFGRAVRDLATGAGKEVDLVVTGADTGLDRVLLDGTREALTHLLRNAIAHGIEPPEDRERAGKPRRGRIELRAEPQGDRVLIEVVDDGRGVPTELLRRAEREGSLIDVLSEAGLSTATAVSHVAGRGVGMDAVRRHAEGAGGTLVVDSEPGAGTRTRLLLPVSLALMHVLLAERDGWLFGVPVAGVDCVLTADVEAAGGGRHAIRLDDEPLSAVDVLELLGAAGPDLAERSPCIVVSAASRRTGVLCDRLAGEQEVVLKPLGRMLSGVPGYLGAALLGDERIALVLDCAHLVRAGERAAPNERRAAARPVPAGPPSVLVVDDQFTVRELQRSILEAAGYTVVTARDGRQAWDMLVGEPAPDLVLTDLEMPEMDGLELVRAIRRRPELSQLAVVILSSRDDDDAERRGLEAGADAYIHKQRFDQHALLDIMADLIR